MKRILSTLTLGLVLGAHVAQAAKDEDLGAKRACSSGESWNLGGHLNDATVKEFEEFLLGTRAPVQGFADALALRRRSSDDKARAFAEYWMARSLEKLGFVHLSQRGFAALAARDADKSALRVQLAALECLVRIQEKYPTLELPVSVSARLARFPRGEVLSQAALVELRKRVGEGRPHAEVQPVAELIDQEPHKRFAQILVSANKADHEKAIALGREFIADRSQPGYDRYVDDVRLLLGRALFSRGQFAPAVDEFKLISRSSNALAQSLSDLSWAQLRDNRPNEAVGTAINLQSGGLRRTFAPEAPMVMAMAFNELCHFPESLKAVEYFRTAYADSYAWLQAWYAEGNQHAPLYPKAVGFLRKEKGVPEKIASEWIRSPLFIARQDEVQVLLGAKAVAEKAEKQGVETQRQLAAKLLEMIKDIKARVDKARQASGESTELPHLLRQDIGKMKDLLVSYRRLRRAAEPWQAMVAADAKRSPGERKRLVAEMEKSFQDKNLRMYMTLEEIAENLHFLEVEIYQGATQDIIWQNAHPDYKQLVLTFKKESSVQASKTWNWGSISGGLSGTHEIWEDELGAFKADLFDNCESKDKYLSIKQQNAAAAASRATASQN
ncbi:MAG: hypothetical protein JST16_14730 [Bdellovibrionales bacterium]|nr:hypothetical protein [Bdellovibrionales bacterium]